MDRIPYDAPLTQDLLDDPDFPLDEIPDTDIAEMLDDPSHPPLEPCLEDATE